MLTSTRLCLHVICVALFLSSCSTPFNQSSTTIEPITAYKATIDALFSTHNMTDELGLDKNERAVSYVDRQLSPSNRPVPQEVLDYFAQHLARYPTQQLDKPDPGGVIFTLGDIREDPSFPEGERQTIMIMMRTGRGGGGITEDGRGSIGLGYHIRRSFLSVTAEQYLVAVP